MKWKRVPIKRFVDLYRVSENGDVESKRNRRLLKPYRVAGRLMVELCENSKRKRFYVHQLVAICFLDLKVGDRSFEVLHLDGDYDNNHVSNLSVIRKNERRDYNNVKLRAEDIAEIVNLYRVSGLSQTAIAKQFDVSQSLISIIVRERLLND